MSRMKMLSGVLVFGRIATTYVAAGQAPAQVDPGVTHFEALFATRGARLDPPDVFQVSAMPHRFSLRWRRSIPVLMVASDRLRSRLTNTPRTHRPVSFKNFAATSEVGRCWPSTR